MKRRKNEKDRETSRSLIARLNRDAQQIAWRFDLSYRSIEPERANVKSRYGICYEDGVIKIRLRHAVTGRPLRYSSLVSTLCHELAHLRHFHHGVRFRAFNMELLEFARGQGIYRPVRQGSNSKDASVREPQGAPQAAATAASGRRRDEQRPVQPDVEVTQFHASAIATRATCLARPSSSWNAFAASMKPRNKG